MATSMSRCPHLLTARIYLFCWLFQECLPKELSEILCLQVLHFLLSPSASHLVFTSWSLVSVSAADTESSAY